MVASIIYAQSSVNLTPGGQFATLNNLTVGSIVSAIIQLILIIATIILFFVLVGGGIAVITSGGGDPQKTARGRQAVTAALIGLLIVFGAWAIIRLVNTFFGINVLQLNIPSAQNP